MEMDEFIRLSIRVQVLTVTLQVLPVSGVHPNLFMHKDYSDLVSCQPPSQGVLVPYTPKCDGEIIMM
jgi:hypothetical protein